MRTRSLSSAPVSVSTVAALMAEPPMSMPSTTMSSTYCGPWPWAMPELTVPAGLRERPPEPVNQGLTWSGANI